MKPFLIKSKTNHWCTAFVPRSTLHPPSFLPTHPSITPIQPTHLLLLHPLRHPIQVPPYNAFHSSLLSPTSSLFMSFALLPLHSVFTSISCAHLSTSQHFNNSFSNLNTYSNPYGFPPPFTIHLFSYSHPRFSVILPPHLINIPCILLQCAKVSSCLKKKKNTRD